MLKKCVFAALVLTMLFSFCTVFADQDGNNCWCNIDDYGCWNTGEDGGKSYIMFWSEESRQYIMGTGSAPYKFVVEKPGSSNILRMKCGSPAPVVIPIAAPNGPKYDCSNFDIEECADVCWQIFALCLKYCPDSDPNQECKNQCLKDSEDCKVSCREQATYCNIPY